MTHDHSIGSQGDLELQRLRDMFSQSPSFSALLQGSDYRFVMINPAYSRLIGHRDVIGRTVREAFPEVEAQGFLDLLDGVFATGKPFVGKDIRIVFQNTDGSPDTRYIHFFYQPFNAEPGKVLRFFDGGR